jgi:uncharacterized peroxidase-related enzyme
MPLIKTVQPQDATGDVAKIYKQIEEMRGRVTSNAKLFSSSPELLKQMMDFIGYYMTQKALSPELLACIRMLISDSNGCTYCIDFNASMLINMFGWLPKEVESARKNPSDVKLDDKEKQMLLFVLKAVKSPREVNAQDVQKLRDLGYDDGVILDAVNLGSRMSAIDVVFDTFKIERDF